MKNQTIIFFLFITTISGFSQDFVGDFEKTKDSLLKIDSDLILDYHLSLGGTIVPDIDKECTEIEPRYLFWISNGKFYKQKFSECKKYPEIEINHSELLSTISSNLKQIQKAELLPVKSKDLLQLLVDHDDIWYFKISTKNDSFIKKIRRFELETENINACERNVNFESNQRSILNKLIALAHKEAY